MSAKRLLRTTGTVVVLLLLTGVKTGFALDVEEVWIRTATEREAGTMMNNFFEVRVMGSGIQNVVFEDNGTGTQYAATYDAAKNAWIYREDGYASVEDAWAVHPNPGAYWVYFNTDGEGGYEDVVLLGYARAKPTEYVDVVYPPHLGESVAHDLTVTLDFDGWAEWRGVKLIDETDDAILALEYTTEITDNVWEPGVFLDEHHAYAIEAGAWSIVSGTPLILPTLHNDYFVYKGIVEEGNRTTFTTNPEPASMVLVGAGLAAAAWRRRRRRRRA